MRWCEYEALEMERQTKLDVYLARITAMLAAHNNPKKSFNVTDFLLGEDKTKEDLRTLDEESVFAMWKATVPHAEWTEYNKVV